MRVGVLTTSYPASVDDPAGHFVRGFAEWLAQHIGDVDVLAERAADPHARLAQGGLVDRIAKRPALALSVSARLLAGAARRARHWDAIVTHWLAPCGAIGDLLASDKRHLAIAHGSDVALLRTLPFGRALLRRLSRRADLVYVAEALVAGDAPGRVVAMPASEEPRLRTDEERIQARATWSLPRVGEGPLVALYLGRLTPEKGLSLLLDALPENMILLVAGDGPERANLRPRDNVRMLGTQLGMAKRQLLGAADLLIVPSSRDGSPTVVAEARAVGLPILATRVGGLPALVGEAGLCVPPETGALRAALQALTIAKLRKFSVTPLPTWAEVGPLLWGMSPDKLSQSASTRVHFY